jgi:hypothetical protein
MIFVVDTFCTTSQPRITSPAMPRLVPLASAIPRSVSVPGYRHFLTPLRKLILDYDPLSASQNGIR